jgi:hypothetical protein
VDYLNAAVDNGNIDSAIALGMSYSNEMVRTATGYSAEKALENLFLAELMDPLDGMNVGPFIDYLRERTSVDTFESVQRKANKRFENTLTQKDFTYLDKPTKKGNR